MPLVIFLSKRFGRLLLTILVISSVVFLIARVIPGDPARIIAGIDADEESLETIRRQLGTDRSQAAQFVEWIGSLIRFDLGRSLITGESVGSLILERFPVTLLLALLGLFVSLAISIPLGVASAVRRWSVWDFAGMAFTQIGMALPSFWLGILLILIFSVRLGLFPFFGAATPAHFVLPALALGVARAAVLTRLTRTSVSEELEREYVLTARANGIPRHRILYRHVLRNALIPIITVAGIQLGYMLGGAIIIEQVFSIPGLGRLFLTAVYQRDFPLIQGGVVFVAVVFSLTNFLADLLYGVVNPKIRIG
jgi:peptide/nickel transport system permease protein